jgi:hypothetical protein
MTGGSEGGRKKKKYLKKIFELGVLLSGAAPA